MMRRDVERYPPQYYQRAPLGRRSMGTPRKLGRDIIRGAKEPRRRNMRMVEEEI